jgi:GntR family transcriptional repressor for pyruvate dehydrogenase complex
MISADAAPGAVRSPKTAELVARTLRRMVVEGQLKDGDFLPHEAELIAHFGVRRGSRTGARVRVPGPEIVARPAALLLALSGATLADVLTARIAIEPPAAKMLAESGTDEAHAELRQMAEAIPASWEAGTLAATSAQFHRRMVELSGNATLGIVAGMLQEISERHTAAAISGIPDNKIPRAEYTKLYKSYVKLADLVEARRGDAAETHWRRHMEAAGAAMLKGHEKTRVRDIMD